MRAVPECYGCLERLIVTTAKLATEDPALRERAIAAGRAILDAEFSPAKIPARVAAAAQRAVRQVAGNADPFRKVKQGELAFAAVAVEQLKPRFGGDWAGLLSLAALGNTVDFFRDLEVVAREMEQPVDFIINQIPAFVDRLASTRCLLFLTDNAAECYFDLPLYRKLCQTVEEAVYVVKARPVQNDLTLADLEECGLKESFTRLASTGTDSPGLDLEAASPEFKSLYARADLILAKGMGYYETFSEIKDGRVFYLLRAKCRPVAAAIGVPQGSFVAAFSRS
jgi:uncharacterized protein with ATP-grasp and redox domains